jgi:hypothetical protein
MKETEDNSVYSEYTAMGSGTWKADKERVSPFSVWSH